MKLFSYEALSNHAKVMVPVTAAKFQALPLVIFVFPAPTAEFPAGPHTLMALRLIPEDVSAYESVSSTAFVPLQALLFPVTMYCPHL